MKRRHGWMLAAGVACIALAATAGAGGKKKAGKGERDPEWFACTQISDCTAAAGMCGAPSGVNRRHLKAYEGWVAERQMRARCAGGIRVFQKAVVACQQGACQAGPAPADYTGRLDAGVAGECSDISECIISHAVCGEPVGIPASKRKAYERDVRRRAAAADCPGPVSRSQKAVLACEKNRCLGGPAPGKPAAHPTGPQQNP